ncbi:MAG TPA: hypothetical protein VFU10_10935, partial [Gaiellaceae bacterium]|nr:hypothetical protein [Gaiellaceae bacterium]
AASATGGRSSVVADPNPVRTGEDVFAQGRGFCGLKTCPAVRITLAGRLVRQGVRPRRNGTFSARFVARAAPGTYVLVARQGKRVATTRLHVALGD